MNKSVIKALKVVVPLLIGLSILVWIYRDFDFSRAYDVFINQMNPWWMLLSLFFGVTGHVFRGWRWRLTLYPLGYCPSRTLCVHAILLSYGTNLVVPRLGEVSRCTVLDREANIPFSTSLGTVVSERVIDMLSSLVFVVLSMLTQWTLLQRVIEIDTSKIESWQTALHDARFYGLLSAMIIITWIGLVVIRRLQLHTRIKRILLDLWNGVKSVGQMKYPGLYVLYTIGIWVSYFLHFYLAFYSFPFTASLGLGAGLLGFVLGSFAILVPTPNGAGPWHAAVIAGLMIYGVTQNDAANFAFIVHSIQTFLVALLSIISMVSLTFYKKVDITVKNK